MLLEDFVSVLKANLASTHQLAIVRSRRCRECTWNWRGMFDRNEAVFKLGFQPNQAGHICSWASGAGGGGGGGGVRWTADWTLFNRAGDQHKQFFIQDFFHYLD